MWKEERKDNCKGQNLLLSGLSRFLKVQETVVSARLSHISMVSGNSPKIPHAAQHQRGHTGTPGCRTPLTEMLQLNRKTRENNKCLST